VLDTVFADQAAIVQPPGPQFVTAHRGMNYPSVNTEEVVSWASASRHGVVVALGTLPALLIVELYIGIRKERKEMERQRNQTRNQRNNREDKDE
jgi:hypothetical protein